MIEVLRIGWWNSHLAVRKGNAPRKPVDDLAPKFEIARDVVRRLGNEGVHVLVLGESLYAQTAALAENSRYVPFSSPFIDDHKGITLLYDRSVVEIRFNGHLRGATLDDDAQRSLQFAVLKTGTPPITLIASHWPQRGQKKYAEKRESLGTDLYVHFRNLHIGSPDPYVLFCGDFNDDPFDRSLTQCLRGTRDRNIVRKNGDAFLYNPFWRLIGEREHHDEPRGRSVAGTYYYRGNPDTHWYTFDQFLVSRNFIVDDGAWQLVESATQIWDEPPLRDSRSAPVEGFDHFPVVVSLRDRTENVGVEERQ